MHAKARAAVSEIGFEYHPHSGAPARRSGQALAEGPAGTVRELHAYGLNDRKSEEAAGRAPGALRREPIHSPDTVGRNEPCPYGSGKKYKHCHGAPGALH